VEEMEGRAALVVDEKDGRAASKEDAEERWSAGGKYDCC
jgi:hypothetical protein